MTLGELIRRAGSLLLVHAVHGIVLLSPTLMLAGPRGIGWATGCFAIGITAAAVMESLFVRQQFQVSNVTVRDKLAVRVAQFVGMCLLAVFWLAQIERIAHGRSPLTMHATGASFLVIGIVLRIAAIRALGTQFVSDIRDGGLLVRDGIYAWLRHPSEIGLLLLAIGGPLLIGSPLTAGAAMILLLPISLWRMHRENIALAA